MAHSIPVLTSNTSALPEVAGNAAILVDPRETDQIEAALLRLIRDDALREQFVEKGLARARQFSWEDAVEKSFAVYQEALKLT